MGYQLGYLMFLEDVLRREGLWPSRMCELGNQQMRMSAMERSPFGTAKKFFESEKFVHTSIDLNGRQGALNRDLSVPLVKDDALPVGDFDVVTNSGTSEHVADQYECFRNIHELVRVGGVMVHLSPSGIWERNSPTTHERTYTVAFFRALRTFAGYDILGEDLIEIGLSRYVIIAMAFRKGTTPFPSRVTFEACLAAQDAPDAYS